MSISETLFVIGVVFKNTFLLHNFYQLLPVTYHNNITLAKGEKVQYFGIEGSFVSVIPDLSLSCATDTHIRGIRKFSSLDKASGSFGNSVAVNYQVLGKNFHIKITSSKTGDCKFHVTGVTKWEQIDYVVSSLIEQFRCIEKLWAPFFYLSFEDRVIFMKELYETLIVNQIQIRNPNDPFVVDWIESLSGSRENLKTAARLAVLYAYEEFNINLLANRLYTICCLQTGNNSLFHTEKDFNFVRYDIYNGSYSGNIGYNNLYLIHIVRKLNEYGYIVGFSNLGRDEFRIRIEIQNSEVNGTYVSETKKEHLFVVKSGGSVTLSSKGSPSEAINMGKYIINLIRSIVESEEYYYEKNGLYLQNYNQSVVQKPISDQNTTNDILPNKTESVSILDLLISEYEL